jgi:hypothetical protein
MTNPLSLYTDDELIDELLGRCDYAAVSLWKMRNSKTGGHVVLRRWRGNSHTCMGMCFDLSSHINTEYLKHSKSIKDQYGEE